MNAKFGLGNLRRSRNATSPTSPWHDATVHCPLSPLTCAPNARTLILATAQNSCRRCYSCRPPSSSTGQVQFCRSSYCLCHSRLCLCLYRFRVRVRGFSVRNGLRIGWPVATCCHSAFCQLRHIRLFFFFNL
ncbi:hypothetical protein L914_04313, partial [Phytophthora nicotianae]